MNILTTQIETPAQQTARKLIESIQSTKRVLLGELRHNIQLLWGSPNPQGVLDELGPAAGQIFALSGAFAGFLQQIFTQANDTEGLAELQAILSAVKPHTVNPDGTVHIAPEPEQEPEPENPS